MGTCRESRIRRKVSVVGVVLVLGLGLTFVAAADQQELPEAYTSLASVDAGEQVTVTDLGSELLAGAHHAPALRRTPGYRKHKLVSYSRLVEVGKEDVIVRIQSPGKRKSIMMVEFEF